MKSILIQLVLIAGGLTAAQEAFAHEVPDSVGVIRFNGKSYILHKVDKGQTMYALTRRYGTTIADIKEANPGLSDQITENETIRIPLVARAAAPAPDAKKPAAASAPVQSAPPAQQAQAPGGVHRVEVGQTLYSIAGKYGVSMDDIRRWNGMQSDNIILGQEIIVSARKFEDQKPARVVASVSPDTAALKSKPAVAEKVVKPAEAAEEPRSVEVVARRETGLAEIIDVSDHASTKYVALHKNAPVGTLIEVRNEFNQETILVKVIGRLPDTSVNQDIVIKLSANAFEKVSPNTRRFRAALSYKVPK